MNARDLETQLSDLIGFQCVLLTLRGVGVESSEEMLWRAFLTAMAEQYDFRRVWYGRKAGGRVRPAVTFAKPGAEPADFPAEIEETSPQLLDAELVLPVSVEGAQEGFLVVEAEDPVTGQRAEAIRILLSEAAAALAEQRFRARSEEAMGQAKLQAEAANRAKSLMLANMSHEIRTPMTGVLGCADLLAATPLTAEQRDYVDTIRSSGQALLGLINDILDFSKIESGKLNLEYARVDVRGLAEKTVGLLAKQAAEKGLHLSFALDASTPRAIAGDALRLRQVLVNLLGNAVKFTSQGEVSLSVSGARGEDGGPRITFVVRDNGPGIPKEDQERIFDSFSQVDASISRKYGGTGLGLAISRSLAEQMGGSLSVESELGQGATFYFTIPVVTMAEFPPPACRAPEAPPTDLPPLRVIVAEDNPVNRVVALTFLRRLGYQADSAVNGLELLAAMERSAYDVVFMDMQMPEMDGIEATRRVRQQFEGRQPRIVAMTAAAFPEDRARCLEAGMDDFISKPMDMVDLAQALCRAKPQNAAADPLCHAVDGQTARGPSWSDRQQR